MRKILKTGLSSLLSATLVVGMLPTGVGATEYRDNTYRGTARGYKSDITLDVTITEGKINAIDVVSQNETASYWRKAKTLIDEIIKNNTADVDAVTGATLSSEGIKNAVKDALEQAELTEDNKIFAGGKGTEEKPYLISNEEQLRSFSESVDSGITYVNKYIALTNDINMSENRFEPIGEGTTSCFMGTFDGKNYSIKNLIIGNKALEGEKTQAGLFDTLAAEAVVENLNLENVNIDVQGSGVIRAGAIAGDTQSGNSDKHVVINNCTVSGNISANTDGAALCFAAGIVGRLMTNGYVLNCGADADISAVSTGGSNSSYAGGLVGMGSNNCVIANGYSVGNILAKSPKSANFGGMAGGIVAMQAGKIYNVYANCNEEVGNDNSPHKWIGAIAAQLTSKVVENWAAFGYYNQSSTQIINTEKQNEVMAVGVPGTAIKVGLYSGFNGISAEEFNKANLADTLNDNIDKAKKMAKDLGIKDVIWNKWDFDSNDNKVIITDKAYVSDNITDDIFEDGKGTEAEPYVIKTKEQLKDFAASLTEKIDYTDTFVALASDIDVSDDEWKPIGGSDYAFNGTFDGKGYTIKGITVGSKSNVKELNPGEMYLGLFGCLGQNAVVKNVNVNDIQIYVKSEKPTIIGAIVGYSEGAIIDSCSANGTISSTVEEGNNFVSGIASYLYKGAVINSSSDVDVESIANDGIAEAGGITALNNRALIAQCSVTGNVYASADRESEGMASPGGLVGVQAGTLVNSVAYGNVSSGEYSYYTGMIAGWVTGIGKIYQCYYNKNAKMNIGDQVPDPIVDIGTAVGSGVNDEGQKYDGCYIDMIEGLSLEQLKTEQFANTLNENNTKLAADITAWGIEKNALKKFVYNKDKNFVEISDENIDSIYVQPAKELEDDSDKTIWKDGIFYGRSSDKTVVVKITILEKSLKDINVVSGNVANESQLKEEILKNQKVSGETPYEEAVKTAMEKMEAEDFTDYEPCNEKMFAAGDGTENNPYIIENEEQLRYIATSLNEDNSYENKYFKLKNDIVLTDQWKPIGSAKYPFAGNFNGDNHTIKGLTVGTKDKPANYELCGLFGYCYGNDKDETGKGTVIENIQLKDIEIYNTGKTRTYVAGLAGGIEYGVKIKNCNVTGKIYPVSKDGYCFAGGLIGQAFRGLVTNCHSNVDINAVSEKGWVEAGGLMSMTNRTTVINCYAEGNIYAKAVSTNKASVGGLIGMNGGIIINCFATGDTVSELPTQDIGGICGRLTGIAAIYDSYYNSEALQKNGNTTAQTNKDCGVVVAGSKESNVVAKNKKEINSQEFATQLNENKNKIASTIEDVEKFLVTLDLVHHQYYDNSKLNDWIIEDGILCLKGVTSKQEAITTPIDDGTKDNNGGKDNSSKNNNGGKVKNNSQASGSNNNSSKENKEKVEVGYKHVTDDAVYKVTSVKKTKTVTYMKYKSKNKKVEIPSTVIINGEKYKVTAVGKNAFANNKKITSVKISSNIKKIEKNAFKNNVKLKNITFTTKQCKIAKNAFRGINKKALIKVKNASKKQKKKIVKELRKSGIKRSVKIK